MTRHRRIGRLGLGLVTVAALVATVACGDDPEETSAHTGSTPDTTTDAASDELAGFVRTPLPVVADLSLPDASADGAPFDFRAEEDGLLLVYFGFTSCPDVCPTTLADVRFALRDVPPTLSERVTVAMATIDPGYDTDVILTDYLRAFIDDGVPLRTDDDDELRAATDAFGADYDVSVDEAGEPVVLHTGSLYGVDDEGRLVVTWPFGTPGTDLAADLETLLDGSA